MKPYHSFKLEKDAQMQFGLMCQIQMPRPWGPNAEQTAYRNALDHVAAAEAAGFSHLWVTEQHFFMEIGHCSSQDMFLAAASQRTRTMRLGFGVILVPCHNPFMVAERVATLDVLSGGRAEFGFGRGTSPYIVEGLGFDPAIGREVGEEALKAVLMMHENEWFPGHQGKHFNLAARHVVPRPVQKPHPPLWIAASNFETYPHAGRMGVGLMGVTRNTPEETKPAITAYREALRTADPASFVGRFANSQVGAFAIACVLDDDRAGRAAACAAARWYYGENDAELNRTRFTTGGGVQKVFEKISSRTDEELIEDAMAIGGNPDTVCRQVEKWAKAGLDQIAFLFQAGYTTHDQVMRSIELVGERVIPRFA